MFDSTLQVRFAKCCTDAAFGYTRAAAAAYAAMAAQSVAFWSSAQDRAANGDAPWPSAERGFFGFPNAWGATAGTAAQNPMMAPIMAWWGMFPLRGSPACWPNAFALMSAGVPSDVAWPTAEANAAALDAAEIATQSFNSTFASYRSDNGYAMAQVVSPRQLMTAFLLAPFTLPMLPWSAAFPAT